MAPPFPADIAQRFTRFRVRPLSGVIGAEITGIELSALDAGDVAALVDALHTFHVLLFPGQHLSIDAQKGFSRRFGPLMRIPFVRPMTDHPEVIAVLKEPHETGMGVFGGEWHSDFSFLPEPPLGSVLNAVEVPAFGGDTLWCNMAVAYDTLPRSLCQRVRGRHGVHTGAPYGTRHAPPEDNRTRSGSIVIDRANPEADVRTRHPLVCRHPGSGRAMLFVNPTYTVAIEGLADDEGADLLSQLHAHCTRPEFCVRHRWQAGTLCLWDNRSTMHFAVNDYDGRRRLLYRTTIAGARPRPATGPDGR